MGSYRTVDGDLWPSHDDVCRPAAIAQLPDMLKAVSYCENKRIAVQAGGNCGVWPRELAKHFGYVYTFEPDADNFYCLCHNATAPNIFKFQAALGSEHKTISMNLSKNIGAHHMNEGAGSYPVLRIDDLNLPACDFIELDIEGYEYFALKGAEETIKKYRPVIQIEHKLHAGRYGKNPNEVLEYLEDLGYKIIRRLNSDLIWRHHA